MPVRSFTACVYRLWSVEGALLYIGSTQDLQRRLKEHTELGKHCKRWMCLVHDVHTQWFDTLKHAQAAEEVAIQHENPIFNKRRAGSAPYDPPPQLRNWNRDELMRTLREWSAAACGNDKDLAAGARAGLGVALRWDALARRDA